MEDFSRAEKYLADAVRIFDLLNTIRADRRQSMHAVSSLYASIAADDAYLGNITSPKEQWTIEDKTRLADTEKLHAAVIAYANRLRKNIHDEARILAIVERNIAAMSRDVVEVKQRSTDAETIFMARLSVKFIKQYEEYRIYQETRAKAQSTFAESPTAETFEKFEQEMYSEEFCGGNFYAIAVEAADHYETRGFPSIKTILHNTMSTVGFTGGLSGFIADYHLIAGHQLEHQPAVGIVAVTGLVACVMLFLTSAMAFTSGPDAKQSRHQLDQVITFSKKTHITQ